MSAQDRLAAAIHPSGKLRITDTDTGEDVVAFSTSSMAASILAADPTLAQDIEDGEAMRRLREGLPEGWQSVVILTPVVLPIPPDATIAEAADACREALEASRG